MYFIIQENIVILWSIYSLFSAKVSLLKCSYILVKTLLLKPEFDFHKVLAAGTTLMWTL